MLFYAIFDVFLGRYDYAGELGTLAMEERPWLPSLHQKFFKLLQLSPSVRDFVCQSKSRSLKYFDRVVRLFGGEQGFLGAHRIKTMGFLELGIKTGKSALVLFIMCMCVFNKGLGGVGLFVCLY